MPVCLLRAGEGDKRGGGRGKGRKDEGKERRGAEAGRGGATQRGLSSACPLLLFHFFTCLSEAAGIFLLCTPEAIQIHGQVARTDEQASVNMRVLKAGAWETLVTIRCTKQPVCKP